MKITLVPPQVNIVPVIAKADTLSPKEAAELKKKVMKELESHEIRVYQLPECDDDEDEEIKRTDHDLKVSWESPCQRLGDLELLSLEQRFHASALYALGSRSQTVPRR